MKQGVLDKVWDLCFLHSAVQKIGECGKQPPSGLLPQFVDKVSPTDQK